MKEKMMSIILTILLLCNKTKSSSILFVKTYKTGSSTVRSILNRKAMRESWNAAVRFSSSTRAARTIYKKKKQIPVPITKREPWDLRIESHRRAVSESTSLSGKRGEPFDLWTGHAIYNDELKRVLKGENPKVITILRDPVDRFISAWFYFDRGDVSSLIRFVDRAYSSGAIRSGSDGLGLAASFNSVCRQFSVLSSSDVFEKIRDGSWIVLVLEHLNKGLLMMRRELKWDFSDILYTPKKVNARRTIDLSNVPESTKRKLRVLNSCDQKLYDIAISTMKDVDEEGLSHYELALSRVRETCSNDMSLHVRFDDDEISCNALNFDDRDLVLQSALWRELLPEHSNDPFDVDTSYYELLREVKSRGMMREDGTAVYQYHAMG